MTSIYLKSLTRKISFLLILSFIASITVSSGQSATWNLKTSNTPVICGSLTGTAATNGPGMPGINTLNPTTGYSATGFPTTNLTTDYANASTNYFQYAVTNTGASALTFTTININTYYGGAFPFYMYLAIRYSTDNFATSTLYTSGQFISPGALSLTGVTNISVPTGTTLTYRVYGYYTDGSTYRFGNTFFQVLAAPAAPGAFSATPVSGTQINLNATANGAGDNIMLVYNTVNTFGTPVQGTNYVVGNAIPGGGTVLYIGAAGNPFFNHTALIQGNTYYYQLYSVNTTCKSYSTPLTANATTLCPISTIPFAEGFNTAAPTTFPPCWTQQFVVNSGSITFQSATTNPTTYPQEGTGFVYWNSFGFSANTSTRLVSPKITTVGTASVNAKFYWFHDNSAFLGKADGVTLQWSNDKISWNTVQTIPRVLAGQNGWTVYDITLPAANTGNNASVYVGFLFTSKFGDNCSLDNLLVYPTPTCKIPNSPLTASAITTTTATISWAAASPAPSGGYQYYVNTSPVAPTAATTPTGSTAAGVTTVNLTGLSANTDYYFWVRSNCSASDKSEWIGAGVFSTVPIYCTATHTSTATWYLNQVSFVGTLQDVTQVSATETGGYKNYTANSPKSIQAQGQGINVYVQSTFSVLMKAWVDWNGNSVFDDPSELVYTSNGILTSTTTFGFVVPAAAPPGDYVIRIRTTNSGAQTYGPCGVLPDGETEDYAFTVIPSCSAYITAVSDGETCGPGPVNLAATAVAGTTEYRWYAAATGGVPLAVTFTGAWTTPSIGATTVYYVTAYNGCESLVRTPVTAKLSTVPVLTFTPTSPVVCGEGAVLQLNASGDNEEGILINEKFFSGLGTFTVNNIILTPNTGSNIANAQWQNKANIYIPNNTTTWHPAISSGFGGNNFAFTSSDFNPIPIIGTGTRINTALISPTVSSMGYTNLTLNFDLFFSHYLPDGTNTIIDSIVVDVATDAASTNWTTVAYYITDQGIGTRFLNKTILLNSYINIATLKVRIRYQGNWTDGAAVDNIKLSGLKPLSTSFSWSPTAGGNLFTDAAGLTPYVSGPVPNIYIKPTVAQIAAGTPLSFTATATLSNGCFASTPVTVTIGPSQWTGTINNNWNTANNWCSKVVPSPTTIVEIPSGTPFSPVISTAATAGKITIFPGATLTINSGSSLSVTQDFITQGTLANNGRITLNGSAAQTFPGASATITAMSILEINNSGPGVTLNKPLAITTELRPTAGNLALGNNDITIRSQGALTASVSTVGASAGFTYGTGRFSVERYISTGVSHGKSWQFLAAPANGQTIKQSWMENAGSPNANPNPGYGTQIAGIAGIGGGFDATAVYPSMKYYTPATNAWTEVGNPGSTAIHNLQGYFIFVRGDRSVINFSGANSSPLPTILRTKGTITVGPVASPGVGAGQFQSVANPYPSAIDFSAVSRTGGVDPNFYLFDPTLYGTQGLGGYQTITAATGYKATPGSTAFYNTTSNYKNIQSGDAYFVHATGSAGGLNFAETNKVTGSTLVNRAHPSAIISMLSTNLLKVTDAGAELTDGNRVVFDNAYHNRIDGYDAVKVTNDGANFGMSRHGAVLAVEARKNVRGTDTIYYNLRNIRPGTYKLMFVPENLTAPGLIATLCDKYLNIKTPVSLSDTGYVAISITEDPASANADRFMIIFRELTPSTTNTAIVSKGGAERTKEINTERSVSVYPNPLEGRKLQVKFANMSKGKYTLQVTDRSGQVIYNGTTEVTGKSFIKTVDLYPLISAGVYQLKVTGGDGTATTRQVVVQ